VVHCEPAGAGETVLKYFAPYLYRVALSNRRLLQLENHQVTFQVQDRKTHQNRRLTLPALQFLARFLQHVLPEGFVKVRYYGFLHPKNRPTFHTLLLVLGRDPSQSWPQLSKRPVMQRPPPLLLHPAAPTADGP
jgi:hypothetical protein